MGCEVVERHLEMAQPTKKMLITIVDEIFLFRRLRRIRKTMPRDSLVSDVEIRLPEAGTEPRLSTSALATHGAL